MRIGILGSGSWGTALAQVLADNGNDVLVYGVVSSEVEDINAHKNTAYFGDVDINAEIKATLNVQDLDDYSDVIVVAVPTKFINDALGKVKPYVKKHTIVVNVSKGFEQKTNKRISDCIRDTLSGIEYAGLASIIGPSHAEEVILRKLTTVASVSLSLEIAEKVQTLFSNNYLRVYVTLDEVGAEYGVAIKNIIAIASGMLEGIGYGDNAKAALITRGLQEMIRYGTSKGGDKNTFFGLTGVGDLIVTCFSPHSRNYRAGLAIGKADSADAIKDSQATVEGVNSCKSVYEDAERCGIDMPIVRAVYRILFHSTKPSDELRDIMSRPLKSE